MERIAQVGASILIKGDLTAHEDVTIAGRIEGTINVDGHLVIIEQGGQVSADINAKGIIISGSVKGTMTADERIDLRNTAHVEGELATPRLGIADGAVLRGKVEMSRREKVKVKLAAVS